MTKATAKDFKAPGISRGKARKMAKAANTIAVALNGLTCCQIRRALAYARNWATDPCNRKTQQGRRTV